MNRRNPNRNNNPRTNPSTPNMGLQKNHNYAQSIPNKSIALPQNGQFPQQQAVLPVCSGPCVLCKALTVLQCQRCGDFYCSPNCQMKDWPKHRYICFQMPALIPSSSRLMQDLPSLNGYQKRELPTVASVGGSPKSSQNRIWINNDRAMSPSPQHQPPPQQQKEQPNPKQEVNKMITQTAGMNLGKIDQAPFPKNNSAVLLTVFRSSNRIFIRSIEKNENDGYCEVIKTINDYGKTAGPLKSMPSRNAFAITDFDNDKLFYRVQVVSAKNENEINVIYYDFGNEATKKLSDLKEISRECAQLKQYIMLASLKNVPHVTNCDKLKAYLQSFEEIEGTIVYDEKEKPACEVIPWGVEESINKKINRFIQLLKNKGGMEHQLVEARNEEKRKTKSPVLKNVENTAAKLGVPSPRSTSNERVVTPPIATKKRPSQLVKPVMSPPFEIVHLPVGQKNIDIMVVDNSLLLFGYFACVLCSDKSNLQDIQRQLADYVDNGQVYKPKPEEYCIAKFEGSWYRAKALSILSQEFVEVVFIDFLNESNVNAKSIRRYPMDMDYPCKTSLCMIEDLPSELSDDVVRVLKDKLQPGTEHTINEVKGVEEDAPDVFIIKMNQVAKWLNDKA